MRTLLVAFAAGCGLLQIQPALPDAFILSPCLAMAVASFVLAARARLEVVRIAAWVGTGMATGFLYAGMQAHYRLQDALSPDLEGRDIEIVGVISSLPQFFERGVRFEFTVERVMTADIRIPRRLQLSWYGDRGTEDRIADPAVRPGERWLLNVRLKRPHGSANPHGFDYEAWLLEKGIRATGYVRPPRSESAPRLVADFAWSPGTMIDRLRERLRSRLQDALADRPHGGVIVALAIGDQRAIDADDWQVFARTGVAHLMSISGFHVTMIASLAGALAFLAWRRSQTLMLALAAPRAAALAGFIAALLYCMIAGFAIPAQRTLFMLGVAAWALWHGWFGAGLRVLAIALGLVCVVDPWAPLSPGFWLSFGAVAILLLSASRFGRPDHWLRAAGNAQIAVTLGLLPLSLALFQQVSIAGPFANALAIPLVSLVITPLAIGASLIPIDILAIAAHTVLEWLMKFLQWMSGFEWAVWQRAAPPMWTVILAAAGAAWLVVPAWWQWRLLGAIWMLPMLAHEPAAVPAGSFRADILDVGQGLAVSVRTHRHSLLFDAGPQYSPEADGGNRVIVPFLRGEGISRIDALVLSHDDSDHTGGAASTIKALKPAWMASPLPPGHPLRAPDVQQRRCSAGDAWLWDGVRFEFLHPPPDMDLSDASIKDNARSCVLAISAHGKRLLVTADIEADVEQRLLAARLPLRSDVLVVPHHGSKTSSTPEFIDAVAPLAAIIPVGYRNRFRHPAPEIIERYTSGGVAIHRTDLDGAISVHIDSASLQIETWRQRRPRYWYGR